MASRRFESALASARAAVILILIAGLSLVALGQVRPGKTRPVRLRSRYGTPKQSKIKNLPPVLQRLISQDSKISYEGVRTMYLRHGQQLVPHVEEVLRKGDKVRIEFPEGSPYFGQILVDVGSERRHYFPKQKIIRLEPGYEDEALVRVLKQSRAKLADLVEVSNGGRIASIPTQRVDIFNRQHQLRQQLWIDPKSGALLQRVGYGPAGQKLAWFAFSSIQFNPSISKSAFELPSKGVRVIGPEETVRVIAKSLGIVPYVLPKSSGLRLVSARKVKVLDHTVLAQVYTGPGGRLSLFEVGSVLTGSLPQQGGANLHSVTRIMGRETIMLVGKYPIETLNSLIGSVRQPLKGS